MDIQGKVPLLLDVLVRDLQASCILPGGTRFVLGRERLDCICGGRLNESVLHLYESTGTGARNCTQFLIRARLAIVSAGMCRVAVSHQSSRGVCACWRRLISCLF